MSKFEFVMENGSKYIVYAVDISKAIHRATKEHNILMKEVESINKIS